MTKNDNSFHTKLTLQFKDPLLELEYRSFTSSRVIKSPFVKTISLLRSFLTFLDVFGHSYDLPSMFFRSKFQYKRHQVQDLSDPIALGHDIPCDISPRTQETP